MKKLLIPFLVFFSYYSYSQVQGQVQGQKTSVDVRTTNIQQRELVVSEPGTTIIEPLVVDLNNYTHLVLVDVNSTNGRDRKTYNLYEDRLMSSPLIIENPTKDRKKFRENPLYLREIKDPKWVYLYYTRKRGSGNDDINTTVILRDWENRILYSSSHVNVGIPEILYPLIGF